jgi:RNA recognition motif-containing protein
MVAEAMGGYGKIVRVKLESKNKRGFVCFQSREAAEQAMNALHSSLTLNNEKIKLLWAKGQLQVPDKHRKPEVEESKE